MVNIKVPRKASGKRSNNATSVHAGIWRHQLPAGWALIPYTRRGNGHLPFGGRCKGGPSQGLSLGKGGILPFSLLRRGGFSTILC
ncbi:hypothetical protein DSO57_1023881 [Entomophthora muscae]|uniref:Uncharacterized protein n=1 Tax=Entomophthora muscae TaxID=34485 RepID=A0ACC2TQ94_9FUNG|nr:hypothetical protein DSO57_1023881 [Entomophthora muscae]